MAWLEVLVDGRAGMGWSFLHIQPGRALAIARSLQHDRRLSCTHRCGARRQRQWMAQQRRLLSPRVGMVCRHRPPARRFPQLDDSECCHSPNIVCPFAVTPTITKGADLGHKEESDCAIHPDATARVQVGRALAGGQRFTQLRGSRDTSIGSRSRSSKGTTPFGDEDPALHR
jgi:hypothetical protein